MLKKINQITLCLLLAISFCNASETVIGDNTAPNAAAFVPDERTLNFLARDVAGKELATFTVTVDPNQKQAEIIYKKVIECLGGTTFVGFTAPTLEEALRHSGFEFNEELDAFMIPKKIPKKKTLRRVLRKTIENYQILKLVYGINMIDPGKTIADVFGLTRTEDVDVKEIELTAVFTKQENLDFTAELVNDTDKMKIKTSLDSSTRNLLQTLRDQLVPEAEIGLNGFMTGIMSDMRSTCVDLGEGKTVLDAIVAAAKSERRLYNTDPFVAISRITFLFRDPTMPNKNFHSTRDRVELALADLANV